MPDAVIIAGANGAGKTTLARQLLPALYPSAVFLNADEVQRMDGGFKHPIAAGRELLRRLEECERRLADFVVESTLSSEHYAERMRSWRELGYRVTLHFIEVPTEEYAVRRVALRVAAGGHSVPEEDIRRRYRRGLRLFRNIYSSIPDDCYHWFSDDEGVRLVEHAKRSAP